MLKHTHLFAAHKKLGARLVEFGGWEMPVQYTSIVEEHLAVRNAAGLFDISHMGEVLVSGNSATQFLNQTLTNDVRKLAVGQGQYTLMCNERGGIVDDLYAYRIAVAQYLLVINASRIEADVAWLKNQRARFAKRDGAEVMDISEETGAVAVQGPVVADFICEAFKSLSLADTRPRKITELKKNEIAVFPFGAALLWVSHTGYTGEDGFEIVTPAKYIEGVWNRLLEFGAPFSLKPCGLGARDTLRTEVCYPLYGHELNEETTPIEAGLGFFVSFDKGDFVGRATLAHQKANGVAKKLVAFRMTEKSAPPRPHYAIWSPGPAATKIGEVTSGTQSPSLGIGIGMGYVPPEFAKADTAIEIEIRGKRSPAVVVPKPIYRKA